MPERLAFIMKNYSFTLSLCCLLLVCGRPLQAEDLMTVYQQALQNDFRYLSSLSKYQADSLVDELGISRYKPTLSYQYRIADNRYESSKESLGFAEGFDPANCAGVSDPLACVAGNLQYQGSDSRYQSQEHAVVLQQPIYDSARVADKQKSDVLALQADNELTLAQQDLMMRTVQAYLAVLRADDELQLAASQLHSTREEKEQAEKRLYLGVGRDAQVYEAQAAFDSQITAYDLAVTQKQIQLRLIADIAGFEVQADMQLSDNMPVALPASATVEKWSMLAKMHSPQLQYAELSEQLAHKDYQKKKRARWPKVMASASYRQTELDQGQGFIPPSTHAAIGLEVSFPLYNGGSISTEKKQAAFRMQEAKQENLSRQQWLNTQINNTFLLLQTDVKRYAARTRSLASAKRAMDSTQQAYYDGVSSFLDWMQVQRHFYRTKRDLSASRYNYLIDFFRLKQLAGVLSLEDLQQLNTWLQPVVLSKELKSLPE